MRPHGEAERAALHGVGEESVHSRHARRLHAPRPVRTTAVRHGDVIAVRTAVGGARIASPTVLTPVIEAQDAKLG
ncbi:hypothetical protein ACFZC7_05485 [Streptomyces massasporeus]|uniref:hypothetical protein n=1 Tax=Streptomyces massasporeus TaxID=67324 RepID=UPI0036EF45C2